MVKINGRVPVSLISVGSHKAVVQTPKALRPSFRCTLVVPGPGGVVRISAEVERCEALPATSSGDGLVFESSLVLHGMGPSEEELLNAARGLDTQRSQSAPQGSPGALPSQGPGVEGSGGSQ